MLGFFSTINNLLFHQSSLCVCVCVCVFNKKEFLLYYQKEKKKGFLTLSTADLKIVNQWNLSTSKNYQISFWYLFFFVFFYFFFISSISDHNFISVYPKFIRKVEVDRNRSNLKIRSRFSELYGPTTVRCLFPVERFLKLKKPQNWAVQGFPIEPYGPVRISKPWWGRELYVFNSFCFLGEHLTFCHSWLLPLTHSKDCLVPSLNSNSIFSF